MEMMEWVNKLASSEPAPGGGGASALVGSCAAALCGMVCSLTSGKQKYAVYQQDIERIQKNAQEIKDSLFALIEKDRESFLPLAAAYAIPKDDPKRDAVMEAALQTAAGAPMEMLSELSKIPPLLEELQIKGSRLAVSDVGCAASLCASAAESALLNIRVNTKLMKNRECAEEMNQKAENLNAKIGFSCSQVYDRVKEGM